MSRPSTGVASICAILLLHGCIGTRTVVRKDSRSHLEIASKRVPVDDPSHTWWPVNAALDRTHKACFGEGANRGDGDVGCLNYSLISIATGFGIGLLVASYALDLALMPIHAAGHMVGLGPRAAHYRVTGEIRGRLVRPNGQPLADQTVWIRSARRSTGGDGEFTIPVKVEGDLHFGRAYHPVRLPLPHGFEDVAALKKAFARGDAISLPCPYVIGYTVSKRGLDAAATNLAPVITGDGESLEERTEPLKDGDIIIDQCRHYSALNAKREEARLSRIKARAIDSIGRAKGEGACEQEIRGFELGGVRVERGPGEWSFEEGPQSYRLKYVRSYALILPGGKRSNQKCEAEFRVPAAQVAERSGGG